MMLKSDQVVDAWVKIEAEVERIREAFATLHDPNGDAPPDLISAMVQMRRAVAMVVGKLRLAEREMMCMDAAPGHVAVCAPPPTNKDDYYRTPWCHLPRGHDGPHVCAELRWRNTKDEVE